MISSNVHSKIGSETLSFSDLGRGELIVLQVVVVVDSQLLKLAQLQVALRGGGGNLKQGECCNLIPLLYKGGNLEKN